MVFRGAGVGSVESSLAFFLASGLNIELEEEEEK